MSKSREQWHALKTFLAVCASGIHAAAILLNAQECLNHTIKRKKILKLPLKFTYFQEIRKQTVYIQSKRKHIRQNKKVLSSKCIESSV